MTFVESAGASVVSGVGAGHTANDRIEIRGLTVTTTHGVLAFEKDIPQPFVFDIDLEVDVLAAGQRDDLTASVSYADVAQRVVEVVTAQTFDLIETVADRVASVCLSFDRVEAVAVRVRKPQAPAGVTFTGSNAGPAVCIRREQRRDVVIAMGTNLGRRVATLRSALERLKAIDGLTLVHVSPLVETDPVGDVPQPDYLNAVVVGHTRLTGEHLLRELHAIEAEHGRSRTVRWGARTLDLDLIQLGKPGTDDEVRVGGPDAAAKDALLSPLALPHPRAHERSFVLVPWFQATPWAKVRTPDAVMDLIDLVREVGADGVRPGPAWTTVEYLDVSEGAL